MLTYNDPEFVAVVYQLSDYGEMLKAHTNYTIIKFFMAFRKTNVIMITKTSSLINNLVSFSKDQLKQNKGLDIQLKEKAYLRKYFNDDKHHVVTAMNIFMFL